MRRRTLLIALIVIAAAAVAVRAALPAVVKSHVNSRLGTMGEYTGSVADVDIALLRGAYTLHDLVVVKRTADSETDFADVPQMDISLQWGALFRGELVGEIVSSGAALNLVQAESSQDRQLGSGVNWPAEIRQLFPFDFNRVEARDSLVTFRAPGITVEESLTLRNARLVINNLTNVSHEGEPAFADLDFAGEVMGSAPLTLVGTIDPNERVPTFDLNFELENAKLVDVNPWLDEFLNVDAEQGAFSMYVELAAADGNFEGYVKPIMQEPKIYRSGEEAQGPFRRVWEALVQVATKLFSNPSEDQVATQIPLSGEIENPDAGILPAVVNLLRNAFVVAFSHSLEGTISLRDVDDREED